MSLCDGPKQPFKVAACTFCMVIIFRMQSQCVRRLSVYVKGSKKASSPCHRLFISFFVFVNCVILYN